MISKRFKQMLGARIGRSLSLCNGRRLFIVVVLLIIAAGCKEDEPAIEAVDQGPSKNKMRDMGVVDVPIAPIELLRRLPKPPPGIRALPGEDATPIKDEKSGLRPSRYGEQWFVEMPDEGPYKMVHYQLSRDGKRVDAVLATLHEGYRVKERVEALEEAIKIRLGKGSPYDEKSTFLHTTAGANYTGTKWSMMDFRIDLRTDKSTGDVELLFNRRGRVDPTGPAKK